MNCKPSNLWGPGWGLEIEVQEEDAGAEVGKASRDQVLVAVGANGKTSLHGDVIPALLDWIGRLG